MFLCYVFCKYLDVQIFKYFKLKFSKATCVSLPGELRKRRDRDRAIAKQAVETKKKREKRLSKRRDASFCLKF